MFDRIESITGAAVWDGYNGRASDAPNFARYNLIYGWNASGWGAKSWTAVRSKIKAA